MVPPRVVENTATWLEFSKWENSSWHGCVLRIAICRKHSWVLCPPPTYTKCQHCDNIPPQMSKLAFGSTALLRITASELMWLQPLLPAGSSQPLLDSSLLPPPSSLPSRSCPSPALMASFLIQQTHPPGLPASGLS